MPGTALNECALK